MTVWEWQTGLTPFAAARRRSAASRQDTRA